MKIPRLIWRLIQFGPRMAYAIGLGPLVGRSVLLLTTFGRKSGLARVTPLVYEQRGEAILVASARGAAADWLRNIQANPRVIVRVGGRRFEGIAQQSTDPEEIADYLQRQLDRNPTAFGAILRADGLPTAPSHADLVLFAPKRPLVIIRPTREAA
jgi:deazaflavin-dependent oxidoreductase (nitroreductase family)